MSTSNDSDGAGEEEEYTTCYTKMLLQQTPNYRYHVNGGTSSDRYNNSSLHVLLAGEGQNYYHHQNNHRGVKKHTGRMHEDYPTTSGRKRLGVRLIQQRWTRGGLSEKNDCAINQDNEVSDYYCNEERSGSALSTRVGTMICHDDDKRQKRRRKRANSTVSSSSDTSSSLPSNDTSNSDTANTVKNAAKTSSVLPVKPTLLFRRSHSNLYYSNERQYTNIQFLNSAQSVVIGVDNYGDLDVVRVPSSATAGGGGGMDGIGTLQADRMSLCKIHNNNHDDGGPRYPMDKFHCELFGYDNGRKFAVGLRSGQVKFFTTEHAAAAAGKCLNQPKNAPTSTSLLGNTNALWSCLPSTSIINAFGPQRRFHKSDKYPLSTMLLSSSSTTTTQSQRTSLFDAYKTSFLEEISDWDKTNDHDAPNRNQIQGNECPWAFREGGCGSVSGAALIGACIDAEQGDCFSLRVMDERLQQSNGASTMSMNVVVADDTIKPTNCSERVDSVCFSGEYGLVTCHSITANEEHTKLWHGMLIHDADAPDQTATCIKWWDHRMLRSHQPVSAMCLSFPRDNVSLLSPDAESYLFSSYCDSVKNQDRAACTPSSLRKLSTEQPLDRTHFGSFQVNRLVGARDSSDRFAVHVEGVCSWAEHIRHDEVLMIDSCRGEITQQIRNANLGGLSISSYLDTMACYYTAQPGIAPYLAIYDVSRERRRDVATSRYEHDPLTKKRLLEVSDDDEEDRNNEGLLRTLLPEVLDRYGIDSTISCMAIDDYGAAIACGTSDGDMYLLNSSDLDELATEK